MAALLFYIISNLFLNQLAFLQAFYNFEIPKTADYVQNTR